MILHIFNPSHDEALAANYPYYYPSTIARQLSADWGALPALWAESGDYVWLPDGCSDDANALEGQWCEGIRFVSRRELTPKLWNEVTKIEPWGWDLLLRHQLRRAGAPESLLPTDASLARLRTLSSRATTSQLLHRMRELLQNEGIPAVGSSLIASSMSQVEQCLSQWHGVVAKSLWSCSGRGVFRLDQRPTASDTGRLMRLFREQGSVELQTYLPPRLNFALEFSASPAGGVHFLGASLFCSGTSGAYAGNVVAPQADILHHIACSLEHEAWLDTTIAICREALTDVLGGQYEGVLGVDMMIVDVPDGVALMPCVEVNVRRTMGHVALAVARKSLRVNDLPSALRKPWCSWPQQ